MREIIFRGRRVGETTWTQGWYAQKKNPHSEDGLPITYLIADLCPFGSQVDGETVSQYTGLTDKNGKQVFEGDILKIWKKSDSLGTYYFPPVEYPVNVVVKWDLCSWMWEVQGKERYYIHFPEAWCHYECEVIGNVWDDPWLLTEETRSG